MLLESSIVQSECATGNMQSRWILSQDTGYRIHDTRYRIHDTGYVIQDTGYKIQDTRYRIRDRGYKIHYFPMSEGTIMFPRVVTYNLYHILILCHY